MTKLSHLNETVGRVEAAYLWPRPDSLPTGDRGKLSGLARGLYPTYGLILLLPLGGAS